MAIFGSFGAHRRPKMACSNLFRQNIIYPNIFTLIFIKKRKKKFFFEFNNPIWLCSMILGMILITHDETNLRAIEGQVQR